MENSDKKVFNIGTRSFVTALIVLFVLMAFTYALTFLLPAGQYDRGRPSEVCATKLRIISRLTGAIRDSRDADSIAAKPYSWLSPLPPCECTAWSTARADASPAAYLAMFAASAAPPSSPAS